MYQYNKRFILLFFIMIFMHGCGASKQADIHIENKEDLDNIVEVAILGSGPAGLTAAIYAARANRYTVVFHGNTPGGLLTQTTYVENWPGYQSIMGPELIENMQKHAQHLGARFVSESIVSVDFSSYPYRLKTEDGHEIQALSVIIATGASPALLQVPGEREYWGKGVTACAVCDAPFYKSEDVVVVGGGDSAVEEAMQLAGYASNITVLVRKDRMRAAARMQDLLSLYKNVKVLYNREVVEIKGNGTHMTGLVIRDSQSGETYEMPVKGLFLAIGHVPNSQLYKGSLRIDNHGYVTLSLDTQQTSVPGVFAAGDVSDYRYRQAIHAAGQGCAAALDADKFLYDHGLNVFHDTTLLHRIFIPESIRSQTLPGVESLSAFTSILEQTDTPIILDFYTDQCPSCKGFLPTLERAAFAYQKRVKFLKVNADAVPDITKQYKVIKVPTLIVFKKGKEVLRVSDALNQSELTELLEKTIAP